MRGLLCIMSLPRISEEPKWSRFLVIWRRFLRGVKNREDRLVTLLNNFFDLLFWGPYTRCKTQNRKTPYVVRSLINAVFGTLLYQVQNSELAKVLRGLHCTTYCPSSWTRNPVSGQKTLGGNSRRVSGAD